MEFALEYWRQRLADAVDRYGSFVHPEVVRVSQILDDYVAKVQRNLSTIDA